MKRGAFCRSGVDVPSARSLSLLPSPTLSLSPSLSPSIPSSLPHHCLPHDCLPSHPMPSHPIPSPPLPSHPIRSPPPPSLHSYNGRVMFAASMDGRLASNDEVARLGELFEAELSEICAAGREYAGKE